MDGDRAHRFVVLHRDGHADLARHVELIDLDEAADADGEGGGLGLQSIKSIYYMVGVVRALF